MQDFFSLAVLLQRDIFCFNEEKYFVCFYKWQYCYRKPPENKTKSLPGFPKLPVRPLYS